MKLFDLNKERWVGSFTYDMEDEDGVWEGEEVRWIMEIVLDQDAFTGTRIDEETEDVLPNGAQVEGFKEGEEINFIVKYPCNFCSDPDTGKIELEPDEEHPGAKYSGSYNHDRREYSGKWEVDFLEERIGSFQGDYHVHIMEGSWKMKRDLTTNNKS